MSTHCSIIVRMGSQKYVGIYCHWDGYDEGGVGETLRKNFNNEESAKAIVALGGCSCICNCVRVSPIGPHSYDKPEEGTIIAYHRDRGEGLLQETGDNWGPVARKLDELANVYVWEDGKWTHYNASGKRRIG